MRNKYDFAYACSVCLGNKDFVKEFNRLTGHKLGVPRTPIEKMIDEACGRDPDAKAMPDFVNLVYELVWSTLPDEAFVDEMT